jgi:hypothetical protein
LWRRHPSRRNADAGRLRPRDAVASMGPENFAENLAERFTGASDESVRAVAEAVMNNHEAAYMTAMKDVMKKSMTLRLERWTTSS